jgi:hypothetical protein
MNNKPRIVEVYKRVRNNNPLTSQAWDEVGEPIAYEVCCHGLRERFRTLKAAEKAAQVTEDFHNKFFPCGNYACAGIRYHEVTEKLDCSTKGKPWKK